MSAARTTRWRDGVLAARATWAVSTSPPMPRRREWMHWIDARRALPLRQNADEWTLEEQLVAVARSARARPARCPTTSLRMYAALVSFVDDYRGPFPEEMFPRDLADALRSALRDRAGASELTVDEQLAVALGLTDGDALAAATALHAVTRLVARNRDTRALGDLAWPDRLRDAAWIAPFAPAVAGNGDAPGDTYHYWANFTVGLYAALRPRLAPRAVRVAFSAGPMAMKLIREGIFGSELFAGTHARCDRMGLRHGRAVAGALEVGTP